MAFNDALFQLGMDLTRSSPAQKEDHDVAAPFEAHNAPHISSEINGDALLERASGRFAGTTPAVETHVTIDVFGNTTLDDVEHVEATLARCVDAAGATLQHLHLQPGAVAGGMSGLAVLENGHLSFHSRPAAGYAVLEITTLDDGDANRWIEAAKSAFQQGAVVPRARRVANEPAAPSFLAAVLPQRRRRVGGRQMRVKAA